MKNVPHGTRFERFIQGKDIRRHTHENIYIHTHQSQAALSESEMADDRPAR